MRLAHLESRVTQNVRREAGLIINIFMAVGVPEARGFGADEGDDGIGLGVQRGQATGNPATVFS